MQKVPVKCRRCRFVLFLHPDVPVLTAHGENVDFDQPPEVKDEACTSVHNESVWYIEEESLPEWITIVLDETGWIKGKLCCPNCQARLGSFDFVSGSKCSCGSHILPAVHIVKSKVDCIYERNTNMPRVAETVKCDFTVMTTPDGDPLNSECAVLPLTGCDAGPSNISSTNLETNPFILKQRNESDRPESDVQEENHFMGYSVRFWSSNPFDALPSEEEDQRKRKKSKKRSPKRGKAGQLLADNKVDAVDKATMESLTCAVCLDLYMDPFKLQPCGHSFCEICLRCLGRNDPTHTPCPLCRQIITSCVPDEALSKQVREHFPRFCIERQRMGRKSNAYNFPLPWQPKHSLWRLLVQQVALFGNVRGMLSLHLIMQNLHIFLPTMSILIILNFISVTMFLISYYLFSFLPGLLFFCCSLFVPSLESTRKNMTIPQSVGGFQYFPIFQSESFYINMILSAVTIWIIHAVHQWVVDRWRN